MNEMHFKPGRRAEKQYAQAIMKIMKGLRREMSRAESPFELVTILRGFARSPTFQAAADRAALAMITHVLTDNGRSWREAARINSRGRRIYRLLLREITRDVRYRAIIDRNSLLIRSMAEKAALRVSRIVAEKSEAGLRPEAMINEILSEWPSLTSAHARLIARTETSKASTALTEVRAEAAGLPWYVWRTSEDARVRSGHRKMDGVLVRWDEPPDPEKLAHEPSSGAPYHAGNIYNCRCYPEPLLDPEDVTWPHKVYHAGSIRTMTLAAFKKLNGGG